jgi:ElaB/YqjD/DUF883 family membrane-anchored ribosome-binding protein
VKHRFASVIKYETPEEIAAHISQLMDEAEAMLVGPAATSAGESYQAEFYDNARRKLVDGARRTDATIRAHPYPSLAVALAVGVLLGLYLRRNHS